MMKEKTAFIRFLEETKPAMNLIVSTNDRKQQLEYVSYFHALCEAEFKDNPIKGLMEDIYIAIEDCIDFKNPSHKIAPDTDIKRICNNTIRLIELACDSDLEEEDLPKITEFGISQLNRIISRERYLYKALVEQPSLYYKRLKVGEDIVSMFNFYGNKYIRTAMLDTMNSIYGDILAPYEIMIVRKAKERCESIAEYCSAKHDDTSFTEKNKKQKFLNDKEYIELLPYKLEATICTTKGSGVEIEQNKKRNLYIGKQIMMIEDIIANTYEKYNLHLGLDSYALSKFL